MTGRVVSIKMQNTAVVLIEFKKTHPLYGKKYTWSKKYFANDPLGVKLGDIVDIIKIRPISKLKHWQITKILGKDVVALGQEDLKEGAREAIAEVLPEEVEEPEVEEVKETKVVKEAKVETEEEKADKPKKARKTKEKK